MTIADRTADNRNEGAVARLAQALERIDAADRAPSPFTRLYRDDAGRAAAESDRRSGEGRSLGPLDGRILSIKDLFDVAGEVTTAGSAVLRRQPPAGQDATAVARLRQAGAVVVGKTLMTEFAFSAVGLNPHDGDPGNPHDRARIAGGSSTGAAISVVDGLSEIAIGSDTGGSLRIPAALCGAVGFKPTAGRVPTSGAFSLSSTLDVVGPMAGHVEDCALADAILAGEAPVALPRFPADGFRLVLPRGRLFADAEPAVMAAFDDALGRLRAAGTVVEDGSLEPELERLAAIDAIGAFTAIELGATLKELGVESLAEVDPKTRARIEAGQGKAAPDYVRMIRLRNRLVGDLQARMRDNIVFALPTVPITAPLIADVREDQAFHRVNGLVLRNPRVANLLDCPSISLPIATPGLPVGLMLIGRRGTDRAFLAIARAVEAMLAG
ncbi:MAG: amidase [Rhizobiales bacterium]|nr:amidase [Hyphomicrobiales bacterium]